MTKLTVVARGWERTTREPQDDGWDVGDSYLDYEGCSVYLGPAQGRGSLGAFTDELDVPFDVRPGQTVYPVLARYTTGSTFGHRSGLVYVLGVWETFEQALDAETAARKADQIGLNQTVHGQTFYPGTWIGYFEYLEDVLIEHQEVEP